MKFEVTHDLLRHDGKTFERGDTVDLDKEVGDGLAEQGAVKPNGGQRGRGKAEEPAPTVEG